MTYINGLNSFSLPDEDYLSNYALLNTNLDDINEELIQNYTIQLDNVNINEKKDDIYTEDTIEPLSSTLPHTKKKGRKSKEEKKKIKFLSKVRYHKREDKDNVIPKIKTHFKKFLISLLNLIVRKKYKKQKVIFRNFQHKGSDIQSMRQFMEMTTEDACKLKISKNYTRFPPNQNEKSLIQIRDDPIINTKLKDIYTQLYLSYDFYPYSSQNFEVKNKKKLMLKNFNDLVDYYSEDEQMKSQIKKFGNILVSEYINQEPKSNKIKNNKQIDEDDDNIFFQE